MTTKTLTAKRYEAVLRAARQKHDSYYATAHPRPVEATTERQARTLSPVEQATRKLWVVWLILALAGAVIAVPHTLAAVLPTVDAAGPIALMYAGAVFVGVELALIAVAMVNAMKNAADDQKPRKIATLAGLVNSITVRIGLRPVFDLSHLPNQKTGRGGVIVALLFAASLVFNQVDAIADLPQLAPYVETLTLVSRLIVGALGPGLLIIAGERFAGEVVAATMERTIAQRQHGQKLATWEAALNAGWDTAGQQWTDQELAARGFASAAVALEQETDRDPFGVAATIPPHGNDTNGKEYQRAR